MNVLLMLLKEYVLKTLREPSQSVQRTFQVHWVKKRSKLKPSDTKLNSKESLKTFLNKNGVKMTVNDS